MKADRGAFVEDEAPVVFLKGASPARRSKPASPNDRLPVLVNARGKAAGASSGPRLPKAAPASKDAPGALWRVSMPVLAHGLALGSTIFSVAALNTRTSSRAELKDRVAK